MDDYADASGAIGRTFKALGVRSAVGVPIIVDGRLWGAMGAAATEQLPPDAESRIGEFTELVATAIANIEARAELTASRARIVAAADEERRRVVRDLHDGPQQRLVHAVVMLKLSQRALEGGAGDAPSVVGVALELAQRATRELRELVHGILPAALTSGGLRGGVGALASRVPVPVQTEICAERMPAPIEATAYFVVAEALTNVANHANAAIAAIAARVEDGTLRVEVRDDRVGGARPEGSGLQGLADRLAALDGRLEVKCPADGGTLVTAAIPIPPSAIKR
jgi:signal transduction histidine kinase